MLLVLRSRFLYRFTDMTPRYWIFLKPVIGMIALGGVLNAQSTKAEDLAAGKVLVMEHNAPDPNFGESVILLIHYGPDGVVGLMLNRAASIPVSRLNEFNGTSN